MERLNGIGVSPGIAIGRAVILTLRTEAIRFPISPDRVEREVAALHAAREQSRQQLQDIRDRVQVARGAELAAIFDAQILMLDDALFVGRAEEIIRSERVNAAWAVYRAYEELGTVLNSVEDEYLRERENDIADVAGRLRMNLRHGTRGARDLLSELDGPSVLIADELTASLAAQLDWTRIQGFAVDAGSRTYHTAILARSLKVPAVVGLHDASQRLVAGTPVILNGSTGELVASPSPEAIDEARENAARPVSTGTSHRTAGANREPVRTTDGVDVRLQANVELLEDLELLDALPDRDAWMREEFGVREFVGGLHGDELDRAVFNPTCNIQGLTSGYQGAGMKTVIPARATAKLDFRRGHRGRLEAKVRSVEEKLGRKLKRA